MSCGCQAAGLEDGWPPRGASTTARGELWAALRRGIDRAEIVSSVGIRQADLESLGCSKASGRIQPPSGQGGIALAASTNLRIHTFNLVYESHQGDPASETRQRPSAGPRTGHRRRRARAHQSSRGAGGVAAWRQSATAWLQTMLWQRTTSRRDLMVY